MEKGYVHVYVGENWGKAPTFLGMAIRACGAGLKVACFCFGEEDFGTAGVIERLPEAYFERIPLSNFSEKIKNILENFGHFDMVILAGCCFLETGTILNLIDCKPQNCELVFCDKTFAREILDKADLVSEIS